MPSKSEKVRQLFAGVEAAGLDPRYAGFFACFDRGQYFEAHEVLEDLWLEDRHGPDGDFFKGLIQLAGAFVHLRKNRPQPAAALLALAAKNVAKYPSPHRRLRVHAVTSVISAWQQRLLAGDSASNPLALWAAPHLAEFLDRTDEILPSDMS